jgi:hypothetical protein
MERGPLATVVVVTAEVGGEVGVVVDVDFDDEHAPTTTTQQAMAVSPLTEGACRREPDARKAGFGTMVPATDS